MEQSNMIYILIVIPRPFLQGIYQRARNSRGESRKGQNLHLLRKSKIVWTKDDFAASLED